MNELRLIPVEGIGEITEGDDLGEIIVSAIGPAGFEDGDVLVAAQKVVSKAEGRLSPATDRYAVALEESRRVLRRSGRMLISETKHGFVCANAGVDASNVDGDLVLRLPEDPDLSARRLRARIEQLTGKRVAVVISDTFGRAWRLGQTNVAVGVAGIEPFVDYRDTYDAYGRELTATRICAADELAGAAELLMGKVDGIPAVVARGARVVWGRGSAAEIVRPSEEDLFR